MREAADWVEYCNGTGDTTLANLRRKHGFEEPHKVKYWGIGNEVDGEWQIGFKAPQEYARAVNEFGKVMKWVDPDIKLVASAVSLWEDRPGVLSRRYSCKLTCFSSSLARDSASVNDMPFRRTRYRMASSTLAFGGSPVCSGR